MTDHTSKTDERLSEAARWLRTLGFTDVQITPASADASFRRYFRVSLQSGVSLATTNWHKDDSLILMDAPPAQEDSQPFVDVASLLQTLNVPAPQVHFADLSAGFLLLDDLGNVSLLDVLNNEPHLAPLMYQRAGYWLHRMQTATSAALTGRPQYDEAMLRREMQLFPDWLFTTHLGLEWTASDQSEWMTLTDALVLNALSQPQTLVHRDYHSRNLMVDDTKHISVIDFQDAVVGPFTYDLVSLLRDCYVAWPIEQVEHWACDWLDHSPFAAEYDQAQCIRWFHLMGVQRQLKAAGIFARLAHRDGKWGYLNDVPRTLGYIVSLHGHFPELEWLVSVIQDRCLPALTS